MGFSIVGLKDFRAFPKLVQVSHIAVALNQFYSSSLNMQLGWGISFVQTVANLFSFRMQLVSPTWSPESQCALDLKHISPFDLGLGE